MAHRTTEHTDDETGIVTRQITFDTPEKMTPDERTILKAALKRTAAGAWNLEFVITEAEAALVPGGRLDKSGPEQAAELRKAISHLRICVESESIPREAIAVAGVRVGKLFTVLDAKEHWPVVQDGRRVRTGRSTGGKARARLAQDKGEDMLRTFEGKKAELQVNGRRVSDEATAMQLLRTTERWLAGTEEERKQLVGAHLRRIRRARKGPRKKKHKPERNTGQ